MGSWQELDARYGKLTPALALLVSTSYMAAADGTLQDEEGAALTASIRRRGLGVMHYDELMKRGEAYFESTSLEDFLSEAAQILTTEQKLCILLNLADTSTSDRMVVSAENEIFNAFLQAFGFSWEKIKPYVQAIYLKNNLTIFTQ